MALRTIQERLTHSLVKVDEFILLDIEEADLQLQNLSKLSKLT
jgi:hypothetical protein